MGDTAWSMLDQYRNDRGKDQASVATLRARLKDVQSDTVKSDEDVTPSTGIDAQIAVMVRRGAFM